ncbi:MAG: hypothetical protein GWN58_44100, partial [Anaerolineae bacterium]|nr:hypothetical protein [Anaerolineae bacterium]
LTHAAAGDHTAIQALDIPDSNNETLRQRDPEGALKAEQAWIAKQRALKDTQSYQFFENMEDRLALAQRGQFAEGDSLQNMWDE